MSQLRTSKQFAADLDDLCAQGYRVAQISPADHPAAALLVRDTETIELRAEESDIELLPATDAPVVPHAEESLVVTRVKDSAEFGDGRAGMSYRDLVPGRQGGRIIASHIRIADGGPLADYVHFHNICFQMIYVHKGWVKVVYEDQGQPFVMEAGDCVLQPPHIRHQVLESSAGLEVIEIGAPASHDTFGDLNLALPTDRQQPDRDFGGQRFWRHRASWAQWQPSKHEGFESTDLGLGQASGGVASVHLHRSSAATNASVSGAAGQQRLLVVLDGDVSLEVAGEAWTLSEGDCAVIPGVESHALGSLTAATVLDVHFLKLP